MFGIHTTIRDLNTILLYLLNEADELQGDRIKRLNKSDENEIILSTGSFFF